MPTVEEIKQMGINQIIDLLEQKLKQKLPIAIKLQLALLHGAKATGIRVYDLIEGGYQEFMNYEAPSARFFNEVRVE